MKEYTIQISRYNPETDAGPSLKSYQVPYVEQDSVLGALLYVYEQIDSTLLFNYGCRYRICGKCAIRINGKPGLACETPLEDGMVLEPLDNLPVVRDLAVDRSSLVEPLRKHGILFSAGPENEGAVQPPEFFHLMRCNECLSCLSSCPVFKQQMGYDGPCLGARLAQLHYDVRQGKRLLGRLDSFLDLCIQCKQCEANCPWDLHFAEIATKIKGELFKEKGASLRDWLMARPALVGLIATLSSPPVNALIRKKTIRKVMDRLMRLDERAPFPEYRRGRVKQRVEEREKSEHRVAYFLGCYDKFNDPRTAENSVSVLEAAGVSVEVVDLGCCGTPFIGIGDLDSARKRASAISEELMKWIQNGYEIVFSCSSCGSMIKREYPALFHLLEDEGTQNRIVDLGEYLLNMHRSGQFKASFKEIRRKVGYHASCHSRALRIGTPYLKLLELVPGMEVQVVFDKCCGMAGTMGFKKEKYELSEKVGKPLIEEIQKSQLKLILSDCASCQMKIAHAAKVTAQHPISIIKEAMG